ncbi:MAG: ferrochelatase [Actinomycetota bacterium]|nr:ferrochelatase [Actinomycetota bacterium]
MAVTDPIIDPIIDPKKPFAVILLNLGGPDSTKAVRPFLQNLFSDRSIINLPMQPILARIISRRRAKKVVERYEAIGGGSPILELTQAQADLLQRGLKDAGLDCRTYIGMSYWHPFIRETVDRIVKDGYEQILAFSLFPHFSLATTGACLDELKKALIGRRKAVKLSIIDAWYDDKAYIRALTASIKEGLDRFDADRRDRVTVLFSAHSLPQDFVDRGDPYPDHIAATIKGVLAELGPVNWRLAFQSRSGPVKWMKPQTDEVIKKLAAAGVKNLLVVPISFVSDHIETLYEIDIMYKELALANGVEVFERSPSLNDSPLFIKALTGIALNKLGLSEKAAAFYPKIQPPASSK